MDMDGEPQRTGLGTRISWISKLTGENMSFLLQYTVKNQNSLEFYLHS